MADIASTRPPWCHSAFHHHLDHQHQHQHHYHHHHHHHQSAHPHSLLYVGIPDQSNLELTLQRPQWTKGWRQTLANSAPPPMIPALTAAGTGAATCSALLSKYRKCGTEGSVDRTKNSPLRGGDSEVQLPLLTYNPFPRREARRATRESKITEHTHPHQLGNGCLYRNFEMKHAGTGRSRYFLAGKGCDQYQPA